MKILIIRTFPDILSLDSYNVQEIGLAKALILRGHQCDIVLFNGKNKNKIEKYTFHNENKEYEFRIFWLKGKTFLKNGFMPGVKKILPNYDVIQVHEYDQIMSWQLYSKQRKPTVLYHGPYAHSYTRGYNLKCKVFDMLFLSKRKNHSVYALAKSVLAADFLREKGFEKVVPVGVGINQDNFKLMQKDEYKTEKKANTFRMLYIGKIEDRRNVFFLLDVFRNIKEKHKNIELTIVGDGEKAYKEAFLKSIEEELDEGSIIYKEKALQRELPSVYFQSDVFLFATHYDIFGMVLLEAMYYQVPVISTMNGGASMLIENGINGYIVDGFDLEKWTEVINEIIEDSNKAKKIGEAARKTILNGFTWDSIAGIFERVYEQAIKEFEGK